MTIKIDNETINVDENNVPKTVELAIDACESIHCPHLKIALIDFIKCLYEQKETQIKRALNGK